MVTAGLSACVFGMLVFFVGWSLDPDSEWSTVRREGWGVLLLPSERLAGWGDRIAHAVSVAVRFVGAFILAGGLVFAIVGAVERLT